MKKYELDLLTGTLLTLIGTILVLAKFVLFVSFLVLIIGKVVIFISIMEYIDYKRAFRGEDITKDNMVRKIIRKKVQRKRYWKSK